MLNDIINNLRSNNATSVSFFLFCCTIVVLLLIRDVVGISVSKWVFIVLATGVYLLYDIEYIAIFTCFLIPFIVGLPNSYIFIIGLIVVLLRNINKLLIKKDFWILWAIFIVELLSFIYGNFYIYDFIRFAAPISLISILIFDNRNTLNSRNMLLYFLFAAIVAQISVILQSISINGLDALISGGVRLGNTVQLLEIEGMRISYNPNGMALLSGITISILLILFNIQKQAKVVIAFLIILEIFVGSLSLSRAFLLLFCVITIVYIFSLNRGIKRFLEGLIMATIISVGVYLLVSYFAPSLLDSYSSRLAVEDLSAGRISIASEYFEALMDHPERLVLGSGLQNYQVKYGVSQSSHNGTQEVLITWGIIGLGLVLLYIISIYRHGWRGVASSDRKIIFILPLIILLVAIQSGQFFSSSVNPMYLLPSYAAMRLAVYTDTRATFA